MFHNLDKYVSYLDKYFSQFKQIHFYKLNKYMFNIWAQLHIIEPWERPVKCNLYTNTFGNFENYNLNKYIFNIRGQFHTIEPSKRAVKWLSPDPTLQAEMHNQTRHSKLRNFWILTETRKQSFWDLGHTHSSIEKAKDHTHILDLLLNSVDCVD